MATINDLLVKPAPLYSAQVGNVVRGLQAAGFAVTLTTDGAFAARREAERGLLAVVRLPTPAVMWLRFAGWPRRTGTLAEVRAWLDTFGASA